MLIEELIVNDSRQKVGTLLCEGYNIFYPTNWSMQFILTVMRGYRE